jgi:hypothetical protein
MSYLRLAAFLAIGAVIGTTLVFIVSSIFAPSRTFTDVNGVVVHVVYPIPIPRTTLIAGAAAGAASGLAVAIALELRRRRGGRV